MDQDESKAIYRRRRRIETVNGILKGRGLGIMRVRSIAKVTAVVLMQALAHNLWRAHCPGGNPARSEGRERPPRPQMPGPFAANGAPAPHTPPPGATCAR